MISRRTVPEYIARTAPVPRARRGPWYANIAPSYAGVFFWIAFYQALGTATVRHAGLGICLIGLLVSGLLCYGLYYLVPAMLGMQTGLPLYVVGSSTFGATGGYLMPGLLMGFVQIGWFAVATFVSTDFILKGLGIAAEPRSIPFIVTGVLWGYAIAYVGVKGIKYVAKVSMLLNCIPLVMLVAVFLETIRGVGHYAPAQPQMSNYQAFTAVLSMVLGFFATGGAAGADFGMNSRNASDVRVGGLVGIWFAVLLSGGLALTSVAGAHGINPALQGYQYGDVVRSIGGPTAKSMLLLFALASIPAACFCSFIIGNSLTTMIPRISRFSSTMTGATIAIILAVSGVAGDLVSFFGLVGASFGPICGAVAADYVRSGCRWAGPRTGINWAGYGAWSFGFLFGIIPSLPLPQEFRLYSQPAPLYSLVVSFMMYWVLAKAGLEPTPMTAAVDQVRLRHDVFLR